VRRRLLIHALDASSEESIEGASDRGPPHLGSAAASQAVVPILQRVVPPFVCHRHCGTLIGQPSIRQRRRTIMRQPLTFVALVTVLLVAGACTGSGGDSSGEAVTI